MARIGVVLKEKLSNLCCSDVSLFQKEVIQWHKGQFSHVSYGRVNNLRTVYYSVLFPKTRLHG